MIKFWSSLDMIDLGMKALLGVFILFCIAVFAYAISAISTGWPLIGRP